MTTTTWASRSQTTTCAADQPPRSRRTKRRSSTPTRCRPLDVTYSGFRARGGCRCPGRCAELHDDGYGAERAQHLSDHLLGPGRRRTMRSGTPAASASPPLQRGPARTRGPTTPGRSSPPRPAPRRLPRCLTLAATIKDITAVLRAIRPMMRTGATPAMLR